jgi:hypothetical protein
VVRAGPAFSIHWPVGFDTHADAARTASEACDNTGSTAVGETGTAAGIDSRDHTTQGPCDDSTGSTANAGCDDNSSYQSRIESGT